MADLNQLFKDLSAKFDVLQKKQEATEGDNKALAEKLAQVHNALPNLASTLDEIDRKNKLADAKGWTMPNLEESDGFKEHTIKRNQDAGTPIEKLPFTGKKNLCPKCNEFNRPSLLDLTKSGRWACRTCGVHWYAESLGQKYSLELERFIRGDKDAIDPVPAFRKEQEDNERDQEFVELKQQVKDLNDIILKTLLNGKAVTKDI